MATTIARDAPASRRASATRARATHRRHDESPAAVPPPAIDRRRALSALAFSALACVAGGTATPAPSLAATTAADDLLELRKTEEAKSRERLEALYRELREEEAKAIELRYLKEGEAQAEFNKLREEGESKSREQVLAGKTLCVTPFGIDIVGITEFVALAGATASGISANQKKEEITQLNEKLRGINTTLRQQARGGRGTMDEPAGGGSLDATETSKSAVATSADEWEALSDDMKELKLALREGRKFLRDSKPTEALASFKKSLMLARVVGDLISVRRATRGMGAAKRQLGDRKGAIADLLEVLDVSQRLSDYTGDMDALGAIADLYTELGDLENAGRYYDLYLNQINDETVDVGEID